MLRTELSEAKDKLDNIDRFMSLVNKYTGVPELTSEIVREFIYKVIVHEKQKIDEHRTQAVEIIKDKNYGSVAFRLRFHKNPY